MGYRVRVAAGQVWLHDDEVGGFRIRRDEVLVAPLAGARPNILRLALLGPVLAILLQLRGLLVLHGSAVEAGGRAAVFAGDTGSGKSTTAGALAREGAVPLVDDVVAVDLSHGAPMVLRGAPYLRLMPESLLALGEEPADLPRLRLDHEKRLKHHRDGGATHPVPLGALYLLEVAASIVVTPLAPADALAEILRQSYCADLLPKRATAAHFSRCAAVAAAVPVRRLGRPQALGRLAQLAAAVRDDLAAAAR